MNQEAYKGYSMKWYKFLIYFELIASGILNIISGFLKLIRKSPELTEIAREEMMEKAPFLNVTDLAIGFLCFGIASLFFISRDKLAKFNYRGPLLLHITYLSVAVVNVAAFAIYFFGSKGLTMSAEMAYERMGLSALIQGIAAVVLMIVDHVYFGTRKELFCYDD